MVMVANLTRMGCREAKDLILVIHVKTNPLWWKVENRSTDRALVRVFGQAQKPGQEDFRYRRFMREEHYFEHHSPKKKRCTGGTLREEWSSHGRGGIGGYLLFCFTREGKPSRGPSSRFVHRKEKRWIRLQTRAY